ncbi:MAG: primosomal protein N' [Candidatus Hydrogenedentota bacterium]
MTEGKSGDFAHVALPLALDRTLTYAVPPSLKDRARPGMRAIVPLRGKWTTGYITALTDSTDVEKPKSIIDLPDPEPVFSPQLLELCRWISEYYCCAWGEALHSAVPAGVRMRSQVRYHLQPDLIAEGRFSERQRKVIAELYRRGPLTQAQLAKAVGAGALSATLQGLVKRGILRAETTEPESRVSLRTETYARLREDAIPDDETLAAMQRKAPKQAAVYLDLLHGEPERAAPQLYERHGVNASVLRALEAKGYIERVEREFYRRPAQEASNGGAEKLNLNPEQQDAYGRITAAMDAGKYQTFLLQGITGSGKTEVYLQAIEHALALGKDAIILVPEISLTPQTVGRFMARFEADIAVLHSGLGAGERYDEWRRAQRGEVRIVVGARSAVFAPLPNPGIIVVDEEHDTSYKQGEAPRYHGRDVAIMRAKMNNAVCVLGSATPSVESYANSEWGKSERLELRERAAQAALPEVEILDMRAETQEIGPKAILSRRLEAAVNACVDRGEQAILLLNRRGFAPFVLCPQCGWVASCEDCNVSLTYHAKGGHLLCHYCNARREVPQVCGECHFNPLIYLGTGTQKVEDYLLHAFPGARVERMDADTTSGKGGHAKILGRFAGGEIDVLLGTQMLAKGHDYPGVTVVGVVNADTGLTMPDFRASEATFQLLTQVAGRAGRADKAGQVIVQTYRPKHFAIQAAAHHDYAAFYAREIAEREGAGYPPFRRLGNFMVEAEDPLATEKAAALIHRAARESMETLEFRGMELLGPAPATVRRVRRKYRWNLGVLSRSAKRLNVLMRTARDTFHEKGPPAGVQLKIDLDPYGVF